MLANLFNLSLLLAAPLATWANSHGSVHSNRHVEIAKRQEGHVQLHKRFSDARWSFYDVGLGACGKNNVASDFIVALNTPQYGGGYPGPNCFKTITMTYNGRTTQATVMDQCPGCPYGGLDLSRGLFKFFAPESVGILYGTWYFNDDGPPPPPKPTHHTSTKEWIPVPTFTWKPPKPTTTWKPEPTTTWTPEPTTSTKKSSSSSSSSSTKASTSSTSTSKSTASPTPTPSTPQNFAVLNQGVLQLGVLAVAAAA
ncbi:RlpA-like double-psi beta-barrel-protein domain-containing protein-containing protein [Lyophyllum atratum]|nr:RlpA-like double-psi beta-barrel-protein domain-containing protein-containing protein [Lyophyllum atratum]